MTTIPIEVILQDAESPVTPTPESGGETNIIVPDTGAGTINNTSNSEGIGSSASIILPAIIAILAIGAIVAMLVHKHSKHQNDKLSRKEKLATVASGTIAILAAMVLVGNLVIPATKAASDDTGSSSDEGTYLETEDKVSIVATIDKDSKDPTIVNVKDVLYATTDASGYTVTMSMIEDAITSNLYLNGDETSEYYIAPVEVEGEDENENATKGVELATNTWGYRLSEDDGYLPVPLVDTPATVAEGEEATEHEEINVYYGLKVDGTLPLGTYSGEVEYDIEGNYGFPKSLITMQGMTHEICESVPTPGNKVTDLVPTATLTDTRDNKTYTIAKLADGKCWMTQNLDLQKEDLLNGVALSSANTDHPANGFVLPDSQTSGTESWGDDNSDEAVIKTPHVYDIAYSNPQYYECLQPTPWGSCEEYDSTPIPQNELGNWYNWYVATAGAGEYGLSAEEATGSICPLGWSLPSGAGAGLDSDISRLLYSYGILDSPTSIETNLDNVGTLNRPFNARYTGKYRGGQGIGVPGRAITIWTSRSNIYKPIESLSYNQALYMQYNTAAVSLWNGIAKAAGLSIRCIAK